MRKIPTLFVRNEADRKFVTPEVSPGCEWVLAGEGRATRKFDGTCVLIRRDGMAITAFTRREVKPGKGAPPNFVEIEHDEITHKTVGWEPYGQSGFAKYIDEALTDRGDITPGTYELVGPRINGNPEGYDMHVLIPHGREELIGVPRDFVGLSVWLMDCEFEGIVWHHPDGRMAKLKRRDFPRAGQAGSPAKGDGNG